MKTKQIGICGAGQMGAGIAQTVLAVGYSVTFSDISAEALEKGVVQIKSGLNKWKQKGKLQSLDLANLKLRSSTELELHNNSDLVIEAATENIDIKLKIFSSLSSICSKDTSLCSNTSSLSLTTISSVTKHPENVYGLHFFNPVPLMKLVELIPALQTSEKHINRGLEFIKSLGKTSCYVKDSPGFVANRLLLPMINEAIYCLQEGVADKQTVDTVMKLGMAHPMGPLELADYIGLDTCLSILNVLHQGFGASKYKACPLLERMVSAGYYGRKSGRGFYEYSV